MPGSPLLVTRGFSRSRLHDVAFHRQRCRSTSACRRETDSTPDQLSAARVWPPLSCCVIFVIAVWRSFSLAVEPDHGRIHACSAQSPARCSASLRAPTESELAPTGCVGTRCNLMIASVIRSTPHPARARTFATRPALASVWRAG